MKNQNQIILHVCLDCSTVQDNSVTGRVTCQVCNSPNLEEDVFPLDPEIGEIF